MQPLQPPTPHPHSFAHRQPPCEHKKVVITSQFKPFYIFSCIFYILFVLLRGVDAYRVLLLSSKPIPLYSFTLRGRELPLQVCETQVNLFHGTCCTSLC